MSHPRRNKQIPPNAELYCPQYRQFDRKAREDSKIRFQEHVTGRRQLLVQCVDPAIAEIRSAILALEFGHIPHYIDDDNIINDAITTMNKCIDKWDGVQFSKQFITEFNKSGKKMDATKFATIAKNHQDQTSWKISGQFFAKYIAHSRQFIQAYCQSILNVNAIQRQEITKLGCIAYAVALLEATIRFHRTKAKPLIRYKTLVKSTKIHIELERLYSELKVKSFIAAAKKRRKAKDGKNTVKSNEFHQQLLSCCKTLYRKQKQNVYNILNIMVSNNIINGNNEFKDDDEDETVSVYPSDLLSEADADTISTNTATDNNNSGYIPYESTSIFSQQSNRSHSNHLQLQSQTHSHSRSRSHSFNRSPSRSQSRSPRDFQRAEPRDYSIRNDMISNTRNKDKRDRSHIRESIIHQIRSSRQSQQEQGHNYNGNETCSRLISHQNNPSMEPSMSTNTERVNNFNFMPKSEITASDQLGPRMVFTEEDNINIRIAGDGSLCNLCGQVQVNCHCNHDNDNTQMSMSMIDDATSNNSNNSNSHCQSPDYARRCEILTRENEELRRQRDECRRLLQQMQMIQNQHQQQYIMDHNNYNQHYIQYPPTTTYSAPQQTVYRQQQSQPNINSNNNTQYFDIIPQNDITYFNALPNQLRFIQPNVIIRGSSLNDDNTINNMDLNGLNLMNGTIINDRMSSSPPFIDNNNNGNQQNGDNIIADGDVDIPSLPNN